MYQVSFAEAEAEAEAECRDKRRKIRREKFLEQMKPLVPWQRLEAKIESFCQKVGTWRWRMTKSDGC